MLKPKAQAQVLGPSLMLKAEAKDLSLRLKLKAQDQGSRPRLKLKIKGSRVKLGAAVELLVLNCRLTRNRI